MCDKKRNQSEPKIHFNETSYMWCVPCSKMVCVVPRPPFIGCMRREINIHNTHRGELLNLLCVGIDERINDRFRFGNDGIVTFIATFESFYFFIIRIESHDLICISETKPYASLLRETFCAGHSMNEMFRKLNMNFNSHEKKKIENGRFDAATI